MYACLLSSSFLLVVLTRPRSEGMRKPKIDRLRALLAKKRALEVELVRCQGQINDFSECTIKQLQVAVDDRLKGLAD